MCTRVAAGHRAPDRALCRVVSSDGFLLRCRVPVGWRIAIRVVAGCLVLLGMVIGLDASVSWWIRLLLIASLAFGAWFAVAGSRTELVVDETRVSIGGVRPSTFLWSEVVAIEPSHYGFVFELRDGRRVTARATARSGLVFLPPRYDKVLLSTLRSRIRQGD
jgi:hypothetical protein